MVIYFLLEERSMKEVLDVLLPKILPEEVAFKTIPHNGKSDLESSIPRKLKVWNQPDAKFVIVRDQDSADCHRVKESLQNIVGSVGKEALIRIVCRELEAWYFGDLKAVSQAYDKDVTGLSEKKKYRIPDNIGNPKDELKKIFPKHQQIDGARRISEYMDVNNNSSESFRQFVSGVRRLCSIEDEDQRASNLNR